ncbi:MAG: glycosyltransferase [Thermomicrobiales bacterium]
MIAHSGYNTVVNVLGAGLPMLSVPIGGDQVEQAGPGVQMGAAIMVPPNDRSTDAIREGARKLLADPSYRENAEQFRDRLRAMPGPDQAVALLEQLARDQKPIFRS